MQYPILYEAKKNRMVVRGTYFLKFLNRRGSDVFVKKEI